ncbi:uncharacterized protein FTOL_02069 [Fusarium torulosum]|uniref:Uncharacterized protein n=1 Tax=Fusarium torulosum TaxID=33205 RepID=A0AAE8M127_9HYPO|nr:uncharacterized protein FTOL_02069 [Fusarium torulosum]
MYSTELEIEAPTGRREDVSGLN